MPATTKRPQRNPCHLELRWSGPQGPMGKYSTLPELLKRRPKAVTRRELQGRRRRGWTIAECSISGCQRRISCELPLIDGCPSVAMILGAVASFPEARGASMSKGPPERSLQHPQALRVMETQIFGFCVWSYCVWHVMAAYLVRALDDQTPSNVDESSCLCF